MTYCFNHPEREAAGLCVGCGTYFCEECLSIGEARKLCKKCAELYQQPIETKPQLRDIRTEQELSPIKPVDSVSERASFLSRAGAYLIDLILVNLFGALIKGVFLHSIKPYIAPFSPLLILFYFTYFYGTTGETIGKIIMGLKVVSVDGSPLTFTQGFLRAIGYWISALPFLLGFFWFFLDKDGQCLHDKIAGTYVVRA